MLVWRKATGSVPGRPVAVPAWCSRRVARTFSPAAAARVSTYPAARSASLGPAVLICEAGDVPSSRGGVFARQFLLSREFWSH